jgi:hypothetical protein
MTKAGLLSLFMLLLTGPSVGSFFLLGFIGSSIIGIVTAAAVITVVIWTFLSRSASNERARIDVLLFSLAISFALCLLGGEGRLFFANTDWLTRDAIIHDLVSQPWPFVYRISESNAIQQSFILRAPLAMYMLPAAIGKIFGVYAAHIMLLAQNTILFALIFYFLVPANLKTAPAAITISIFILFSGLDVVPTIVKYMSTGVRGDHFEWWAELFQYSSHITQLFWVPHHAIAGWGFVCLYLLWRRAEIRSSLLACAFLYLTYWSPLAMMGAAPFLAYAVLSDLIGQKLRRFDIILLALTALPAILVNIYLIQDAGAVEHRLLIHEPSFWMVYLVFICVEFMPFVALIVVREPLMLKDHSFLLVIISLLLIPFYKVGSSNDFAMRASIPALALLATSFSIMIAQNVVARKRLGWSSVAMAVLIVGSITGFMEIRRAIVRTPSPISDCNFVQAWRESPFSQQSMSNYLANLNDLPAWMRPPSPVEVPTGATSCLAQM